MVERSTSVQVDKLELEFALRHAVARNHDWTEYCDGCVAAQRILARLENKENTNG